MALQVSYTSSRYIFQTYSRDWLDRYDAGGLVMHDPTVKWGFNHNGRKDWSELDAEDSHNVLAEARAHGLAHGFTLARETNGSRSIASFARADRPFEDPEVQEIEDIFTTLHEFTADPDNITPEIDDQLRRLSVRSTQRDPGSGAAT